MYHVKQFGRGVVDAAETAVDAVMHPVNSVASITHALSNPKETYGRVAEFAQDEPARFAGNVVGFGLVAYGSMKLSTKIIWKISQSAGVGQSTGMILKGGFTKIPIRVHPNLVVMTGISDYVPEIIMSSMLLTGLSKKYENITPLEQADVTAIVGMPADHTTSCMKK